MSGEVGIGICTYNRAERLGQVIEGVLSTTSGCKIVVSDDGSTDHTADEVAKFKEVIYVRGSNKGVTYTKNRALFLLQECSFICLLEDDMLAKEPGWVDIYRRAVLASGIHYFCRVQDKEVEETCPSFMEYMQKDHKLTPIYGPSPRGDLVWMTNKVLRDVGGLHRDFLGVGYAHGEHANRVVNANLIGHPLKWVDIQQARDCFTQIGDTEGGRWQEPSKKIKEQIKRNRAVYRRLKASKYQYSPLVLE